MKNSTLFVFSLIILLFSGCSNFHKNLPQGPWLGVIRIDSTVTGMDLPFNLVYESNPDMEAFYVINAGETIFLTEIDREGDSLFLRFPVFTSEIVAEFRNDSLVGRYYPKGRREGAWYAFYAVPGIEDRFPWATEEAATNVSGRWRFIENPGMPDSNTLVAEFIQEGSRVTGSILDPTGDYRYLDGKVSGDQLMLSGIDGAHTLILTARIASDSTLEDGRFMGSVRWQYSWRAIRDEKASVVEGEHLIGLKADASPFTFAFPGIDGDTLSLDDPRFKGKVVIVQAVGTWCPNCLDEALFYRDIYAAYRDQGLEVVALSFEDETLEASVSKMRRFQQQTGIAYPLLYAGKRGRERVREVLFSFEGVMAYPTTIFIDRKGMVRKVETGFIGPATGDHYTRWADETVRLIQEMLKE